MGQDAASAGRRIAAVRVWCWVLALLLVISISIGLLGCGSSGGDTTAAPRATWIPGLKGVKSGEIEAALVLHGPAIDGRLFWRLIGRFLGAGEGKLPQIETGAEAIGKTHGKQVDFLTALTTGPDRAAISYEGSNFAVGPETFAPVLSGFEEALGNGTEADPYACLEAAAGIDLGGITGRFIGRTPHAQADDGSRVTSVTTLMRPDTLSAALRQLTEDPGCGAQLRVARPLRRQMEVIADDFAQALKKAEVETFVDADGLLRELRVNAVLDWEGKEVDAAFVYSLSRVNEVTELVPPAGVLPIKALFRRLGFNPLKAIEAGEPGLGGLLKGIYARALA